MLRKFMVVILCYEGCVDGQGMWFLVGNVDWSCQLSCVWVMSVGLIMFGGNEERGVEVNCFLQDGQGNIMK